MINKSQIVFLIEQLNKIIGIMENENELNWIRGVIIIKNYLVYTINSNEVNEIENLKAAFDIWRGIHAGNGSFADFYIWRDDFNERENQNLNFENIKKNIWEAFIKLGFEA